MDVLNFLKEYWQILVAVVSVIGLLLRLQFHAEAVEMKLKNYEENHTLVHENLDSRLLIVENEYKAVNPVLLQIQKDIVELKTLVKFYFKDK